MTITITDLEKKYAAWFVGMKNTGQAKQEILELFSTEPDDEHTWSEQDISEQSRWQVLTVQMVWSRRYLQNRRSIYGKCRKCEKFS